MASRGWRFVEWLGRFETLHILLSGEFVRTLLWPTVSAVLTGATGILGGVPLMWVFMASALTFMAVTQSLLRADEWRERKDPLNKISVVGTYFAGELAPAPLPISPPAGNRHQRRAQIAQPQGPVRILPPNALVAGVPRTLDGGQISVEIKNSASFPISVILQNAATEVDGKTPPRSVFPKPAGTIPPGGRARVPDERINMNGTPCGRLSGKLDMLIKYGLPGEENLELRLIAELDIVMEDFGLVTQVLAGWRN